MNKGQRIVKGEEPVLPGSISSACSQGQLRAQPDRDSGHRELVVVKGQFSVSIGEEIDTTWRHKAGLSGPHFGTKGDQYVRAGLAATPKPDHNSSRYRWHEGRRIFS